MEDKILNTKNLYSLLDFEPYVILTSLVLLAWFFYKVFLKEANEERHRNLKRHFKNLIRHYLILTTLFATFLILHQGSPDSSFTRATPYVAIATLLWGMIIFVKTCRLIILQYLFLGSMKHGVPVLIVNIFSLVMSIVLGLWMAGAIFSVQLTPLLATSAAVSVILGLAMQDTLGNLFAGISLQFDKAFDIGDWLEVTSGMQKATGQVKEITWRATVLVGWSDEQIILSNRFLANSQIANYSIGDQPIIRSLSYRVQYDTDLNLAKRCLLESVKEVKNIRSWPEPVVVASEMTDSWVTLKLAYYIENFGSQYGIADSLIDVSLKYLKANGIQSAPPRLQLQSPTSSPSASIES